MKPHCLEMSSPWHPLQKCFCGELVSLLSGKWSWVLSRTVKVLRVTYLYVNKWACHSSVGAGRGHVSGSETKIALSQQRSSKSLRADLVLQACKVLGWCREAQVTTSEPTLWLGVTKVKGKVWVTQSCLTRQPWTVPARFLWPWDSPGKNTGVSSHFVLQGIFLIHGSNPGLPCCRQIDSLWSEPPGLNHIIIGSKQARLTFAYERQIIFIISDCK